MKLFPYPTILAGGLLLASAWFFQSCAPVPTSGTMPPAPASEQASAPMTGRAATRHAEQPKTRPGLGTGWGSEIHSDLSYTSFTRASSKPAGMAKIYYNDKEGIAAMAGSWRHPVSGMQRAANGLVEWGVKNGWSTLKNYQANGKRYVVGRKGGSYQLVVKNLCHSRLEVVLSVDGLDVTDGRPASTRKRGYIIQPGKTLTVKGFRTSESAVAAFKFSSVSASYSNLRHGTTRNVGVIGIAVFTEKGTTPWKWSRPAIRQRHSATPFAEAPNTRAR